LTFVDIMKVFGDMDHDGFYMGEIEGIQGLVPSNFLTEYPIEYSPAGGHGTGREELRRGQGFTQTSPRPGAHGPPPPSLQRYSNQITQNQTDQQTAPDSVNDNRHVARKTTREMPSLLPEFPNSSTTEPSDNASQSLTTEETVSTNGTNIKPQPNLTNPIPSKLPSVLTDAPGTLMQKFSDFTHSAIAGGCSGGAVEGGEVAEESMLYKVKDMIFKRFGF